MHADDVVRASARGRDRIDVERRGIGREHRPGAADRAEACEHLALHGHVLEHRLDHEVGVGERREVGRRHDTRRRRGGGVGREPPLARSLLEGRADPRDAGLDRHRLRVHQRHRIAGARGADRDAAAHRARADDPDAADLAATLRRGAALGEEQVPERPRLGRDAARLEQFPGARERDPERLGRRRLDRLDDPPGGGDPRGRWRQRAVVVREETRRRRAPEREIAGAAHGRAGSRELAGEGDGAVPDVARQLAVDDAERPGGLEADRCATRHHPERLVDADHARQPHGSPGARQQAQLDLRQSEGQVARRAAVVAGERELRAAAERRAVQRGHDRLAARLEPQQHVVEQWLEWRRIELVDVGAGDEVPAAPMHDDRPDPAIGVEGLNGGEQRGADWLRERVDRRVLDLDEADFAETRHRDRTKTRSGHRTRSRTAAMPWPTPMHIVQSA